MYTKKTTKKKTRLDLVRQAIADFRNENKEWKEDLYSVETYIDALLYEKQYQHLCPSYIKDGDEIFLERLTFDAIKIIQKGKRHRCDPYYDDAFGGYDGF